MSPNWLPVNPCFENYTVTMNDVTFLVVCMLDTAECIGMLLNISRVGYVAVRCVHKSL